MRQRVKQGSRTQSVLRQRSSQLQKRKVASKKTQQRQGSLLLQKYQAARMPRE